MVRTTEAVVYLDTHVVAWLYAGLLDKITIAARQAIDKSDLYVSPMAILELQYLFEIGRLKVNADTIVGYLSNAILLKISDVPMRQIIRQALTINWTRDVFDRLQVAEAITTGYGLVSADKTIRSNFKSTIW